MQVRVLNGDIEGAIRKLKRALHDEGLIKEVLRRRYYEPPSVKRRRRRAEAISEYKRARRIKLEQDGF